MLLKEVCVLDVASCGRNTGILEASRMMRQHHAGDLVVVDIIGEEHVPVGIITDRDIVLEVLAAGLDPATTKVSQVMSSKLVIAGGDEDTSDAIERMRLHGVRRLPVVDDNGRLLGIVTLDDLFRRHAAQAVALSDIVSKEQSREYRTKR